MGWHQRAVPALWYLRIPSVPARPAFPAQLVFTSTETPTDARSVPPTHTWLGDKPTARTRVSRVDQEVSVTR